MEQEKVAPSVPGAVGLHHPRWDNSVSPVLVTQCSVVCDSTLSEILQTATDSRCPLHQIALVFSGGFLCISSLKTSFYLLYCIGRWAGMGVPLCKCGVQRSTSLSQFSSSTFTWTLGIELFSGLSIQAPGLSYLANSSVLNI